MPCEVTPIPFVEQQLPYNPKFVREAEGPHQVQGGGSLPGGGGMGMGMSIGPGAGGAPSVYGPGPSAAAASVLIPPSPGGQAGPYNAIPALPDAGYTAPGLRATTLGLELGAPSSARSAMGEGSGAHAYGATRPGYPDAFNNYSGVQSAYAPSSYGQQGYESNYAPSSYAPNQGRAQGQAMSTISSASWGNTGSTFPAPRRANNQMLAPPVGESTIAPAASHRHAQIDPRSSNAAHHDTVHHHRHLPASDRVPSRQPHHLAPSSVDDWDARSDASYYARPRPKTGRSRSGSSLSEITTTSNARSHHHHQHRQVPKGSPGLQSYSHGHSSSSPSPLARLGDLPGPSPASRSPLSPKSQLQSSSGADHKHGRKISGLAGTDAVHKSPYKPITPLADDLESSSDFKQGDNPSNLRTLYEGQEKRYRHHSANYGHEGTGSRKAGTSQSRTQEYSSDDERRYSKPHRHREHVQHRHSSGRADEATSGKHSSPSKYGPGSQSGGHRAEAYPEDYSRDIPSGRPREHYQQVHVQGDSHSRGSRHHRPRSHSHVPPPFVRSTTPIPIGYPQDEIQAHGSLQIPHQHQQVHIPDISGLSISGREIEPRRRAHSMQMHHIPVVQQPQPSPASMAGFGDTYLPPPGPASVMGMGMGIGVDDGASVAGIAMTFMDGAMGGRTSQYGLPKYPHQAKPDPRRFMVQRGKADVYLD